VEHLTNQNWLLSVCVFLPLVGVALMAFIPRKEEDTHKVIALATALATLALGIYALTQFDYDKSDSLQFYADANWIDVIKARYIVGLDGLGLPLFILSMVITVLVIIYSWNHIPEPGNPKAFLSLMLILQVGMAGVFVSHDLILFFVFFEIVLLPMYFMIGVWGGENRQYASLKFFLFTLFGSAFMLLGFLALFFKTGAESFAIEQLMVSAPGIARNVQLWIFGGLALGFAVKVPMWPFHTWLPDAHTQAPTQGSVILAAILLKLGTFGFIRIAIPILPEAAKAFAPWIGALAVIGIIYGALGCLAQTDMKRLIAFSSVAHMGYVMLGIATLTTYGMNAAMFGMVAHGLITGMLFFIAGSVKDRYHTLEISRLGGLLKQAPRIGWLLGLSAMASLGLPGLAGFWGEFPAIMSAYEPAPGLNVTTFRIYMVIAAVGTVLAAAYLLWLLQRVAFGEPKAEFANGYHGHAIHDMHFTEYLAWTPMIIGIIVLGVMPNILFKLFDPTITNHIVAAVAKVG
jgi:NADH-quinone oxidoreductase subunit M